MSDLKAYTMPYDGALVRVEVMFMSDAAPPLVVGICGALTSENLNEIEDELEYFEDDDFHEGPGLYLFDCNYFPGQYGEFGVCELQPGWEMDAIGFRSFKDEAKRRHGEVERWSEDESHDCGEDTCVCDMSGEDA